VWNDFTKVWDGGKRRPSAPTVTRSFQPHQEMVRAT
jgi:hypothetical protein